MLSEEQIAPCPFCGGSAQVEQLGNPRQSQIYSCTECGCSLETGETFGVQAWNRRTPSPETPDGFVLVPVEPTQDMRDAASEYDMGQDIVYRAMIAARPTGTVAAQVSPADSGEREGG